MRMLIDMQENLSPREIQKFILKLMVSFSMLFYLSFKVDFGKIIITLADADHRYYLMALLMAPLIYFFISYSLRLCLGHHGGALTNANLFKLHLEIMFYDIFTPQPISALIKWKKLFALGLKKSHAFMGILRLKLVQILSRLIVGVIGIYLLADIGNGKPKIFAIVLLLFFALVTSLLFNNKLGAWLTSLGRNLRRKNLLVLGSSPIRERVSVLSDSLRGVQLVSKKTFFYILLLNLLTIIIHSLVVFFIACSIGVNLSYGLILVLPTLAYIISLVPISVHGLGIRESAFVYLLNIYDVPEEKALLLSLMGFSITVIYGLLGGALEGFSFFRKRTSRIV